MKTSRILYIDDEVDLLDLAMSFFEDEDLSLETASTFDDALSLIRQNDYDLIISDAKMPTGSGFELLKVIQSENRLKGKIILVTGNMENIPECHKLGYDLVVYKPINFQELIETAKSILIK